MTDSPYMTDGLTHLAVDDRRTLCGRFVAYQQDVSISTDLARLAALAAQYARTTCPRCAAAAARCSYPGCLGPADGSECRHPQPSDDLCPDCGVSEAAHLSADEATAIGHDTRDGRGCVIYFRFDTLPLHVGRTHGTRWNGFLNVSVDARVMASIRSIFAALVAAGLEDPSVAEDDYWPVPDADGWSDLSGGFATSEAQVR